MCLYIKILENKLDKEYYVYLCFVDNVLRYVGKGTGDRFKHCNSGKSTCALLNRDYFNDCKFNIVIYKDGFTEKDALAAEKELIDLHSMTLYNVSNNTDRKQDKPTPAKTTHELNSWLIDKGILRMTTLKQDDGSVVSFTASDKLLYSVIYERFITFKQKGGDYYETNKQIAEMIGMDEKTVSRGLHKLSKCGLFVIKKIKYKNFPKNIYVSVKAPSSILPEITEKQLDIVNNLNYNT